MRISCLLVLALSLSTPAFAQDQRQPESEILVVGKRQQEERREQLRDFVGALSTEPTNSPISRFDTACPGVAGLSQAQNTAVATRMRTIAAAANIPLAEEGCRPNVLVIVVPDKDDMLKALKKAHPILFRNGDNKPVEITKEDGPVTAWHIHVEVDRDGNRLAILDSPDAPRVPVVVVQGAPSRVYAYFRPVSIGAVVLLEQTGLIGLNITQIADYAAMRAFTTIHPRRLSRSNAPTILRLMDSKVGDSTPLSLTQWDLGFLKGAYAVHAYGYAGAQRAQIQRAMNEEMKQADGAGEQD